MDKCRYICTMRYYLPVKKNKVLTFTRSWKNLKGHYAEWKKKLVSKGYLPYDIIICHLHALLEKTTYRGWKRDPGNEGGGRSGVGWCTHSVSWLWWCLHKSIPGLNFVELHTNGKKSLLLMMCKNQTSKYSFSESKQYGWFSQWTFVKSYSRRTFGCQDIFTVDN